MMKPLRVKPSRELGVSALFSTTRSLAYHAVGVRLV
jgi:hypothetical protein